MAGKGSVKRAQKPGRPVDQLAAAQLPQPLGTGTAFERITADTPVHAPDRDPARATVSPTGLTHTNTEGTLLVEGLARKLGLDPNTFALVYGASEEKKQVALYPVDAKTGGAVGVRRSKARTVLTIYLKPVFKKKPALRVSTKQQCGMFLDVDAEGNDCIVLTLGTALTK
ncbi:MAG: hypothetical protein ACOY94_28720 [Bacillota bacterium]